MTKGLFSFKVLLGLVVLNIAATVLHYVDNIMFFGEYPEPSWLSSGVVDAFWFLMTPVVLCGLWFAHRGSRALSSLFLLIYAGMSLLVLGHYRFAPFHSIGMRIHAFIWLEAIAAIVLVFWVTSHVDWRVAQQKSPRERPASGAPATHSLTHSDDESAGGTGAGSEAGFRRRGPKARFID